MKRYLFTTLIILVITINSFGQKIVYDKPDFILHIAPEDSSDGFGAQKVFGHFNSDYFEDLVVLAPYFRNSNNEIVGKIYLYYGAAKGIDTTSYIEIENANPLVEDLDIIFNMTVGDFNGDTFDDLAIGSPRYQGMYNATRGYARVFLSNPDGSGLKLDEPIEFIGYTIAGKFGSHILTADVNGDDVDDFVVDAPQDGNDFEGKIYIYYGGEKFDNAYDKQLNSTGKRQHLICLGSGDINGDGFDDIIGADYINWSWENEEIHVWLGDNEMEQTPAYSRATPYKLFCAVGDLNDDSCDDIIIADDFQLNPPAISPNLTVIRGSSNFNINNSVTFLLKGHHSSVSTIRDINNDGVNDIFVSIHNKNFEAKSFAFSGDRTTYISISDTLMSFVDSDTSYGLGATDVIPADMNGDGEYELYSNSQMHPYKNVIFIYDFKITSLTVTYPNTSGIEWDTGKEYVITWNARGSVGNSVKIELFKGNSFSRTISENTENDGSYSWSVSPSLSTRSDYTMKISSITDPTIFDFSDNFFKINQAPVLKITCPDSAGIAWHWGETRVIEWKSWGAVGPFVKLELYDEDTDSFSIFNFSEINDGLYNTTVKSDVSGENFKIKISSIIDDSVYDFSDHSFGIFPTLGLQYKPSVVYSNKLHPNYPNPFNANTRIRYEISQASNIQIKIYNILGEVVKVLVNTHKSPGSYEILWDGLDEQNKMVAGGIFIVEMRANEFIERQKITLLK